jgi:MoaA/NifB/PqqE/SkfB family radical SAM enzyme
MRWVSDTRYKRACDRWEKEHGVPLIRNVQIQTQSRCNADCIFCPYSESWHAANPGKMTDELFAKVLDELRPFSLGINRGKFCPYLMQEPLLDPKIFDRVQQIYAAFPHTTVEIATNGSVLNEKIADNLLTVLAGRPHEIRISHHGVDQESMDRIMRLDHSRSVKNVLGLIRKSEGRLRICVQGAGNARVGQIAYFSKEEYYQFWHEQLKNAGLEDAPIDIRFFTFHDRAGTIRRTDRAAKENNFRIQRQIDENHPFYCNRVDRWIHVMYDGTIRLCCMDYHAEIELPSLAQMSLMEYFRSEAYREVSEKVCGKRTSPPDFICKRCSSPGG